MNIRETERKSANGQKKRQKKKCGDMEPLAIYNLYLHGETAKNEHCETEPKWSHGRFTRFQFDYCSTYINAMFYTIQTCIMCIVICIFSIADDDDDDDSASTSDADDGGCAAAAAAVGSVDGDAVDALFSVREMRN